MQKILRSPASMRRKPLKGTFGVPLIELVQVVNGHLKIPSVVEKIVEYIESKGLNQEGIFRINGSTKAVDKMKAKFDKSQDVDLDDAGDIMAVAGLLKLFLRELPDPIMTEALHQQFINLQRECHQSGSENYLPQLKNLLAQLPEENFHVLAYLCRFLVKVTDHQEKNKMNSRALSIVFGPNLFRCTDGVAGLQEQVHTNVIVKYFIEDYDFLFGNGQEKEDGGSDNVQKNTSPLKRIVVKPATEKKSPPVKPVSYEQYIKDRIGKAFAKRDEEEKDVNSNSLEKGKEEIKQGFDRQGAMSPCDVSSADERALSPFNLDSDSTVPSPIVSDSAIEVVDRAIKECVSEHLFGSPEEKAPVPTPRTKRLQKKQKEAASRLQQSQANLEMLDSASSVKDRVRQFSIDSQESLSPPVTPLAKTHPELTAFRFFETQGIMLQSSKGNKVLSTKPETKKADKELNNTNSPVFRRKLEENSGRLIGNNNNDDDEDDDDLVFDEEDLDSVERAAPVLSKVTGGRVPPPRILKNTKKTKKSLDAPPEEVPTQLTELDLDSVQRDAPVLQKLTEGRVQPPRLRMRSGSMERSDPKGEVPQNQSSLLTNGNIKQMSHDPKLANHSQGAHNAHQKPKLVPHGPHKALAEAAVASRLKKQQSVEGVSPTHQSQGEEEIHSRKGKHSDKRHDTASENLAKSKSDSTKERSHHDVIGSPKRKGKKKTRHSGKEENDLRVRDIDSPELGVVEHKQGKKKARSASNPSDAGQDKVKAKLTNGKDEERSRSASPRTADTMESDNLVPSLDLSSLHANAESDEPIPAWSLHQRADWLNNMEELTIDVKEGPVEKLSSFSALQPSRLPALTTFPLSSEEAPLSPRAKDTPPCWGSDFKDFTLSPTSNQFIYYSATIEADRTADKPIDKAQNIKQLTRQVRNLKRKIRQYEEEYCEQHGHKPSTAEKIAEPEVKKMMRELKKAAKQLKAAKEQSEESKKPLHSTLPSSSSHSRRKQDDSNSESSLIENLRDALDLAEEWLKEKRQEAGRMDDIFEMSKTEVHDEKVSIQKVLLQLENKYGRPTTRETKEIMKPLYDRYRNLKRLIAKFEVRRTLAEEVVAGSPPDLNTIDEHEETKEFTPKQLGTIHTMYTEEDLEPCMVTQEIPSVIRGLPSRTLDAEEGLASPVDLSGRADSPLSPDSTANFKNLADASLSELIKTQNQALADKKKVRRILKEFEDNFFKEKGRKVQKEDRGPMEEEYNEYKRVKKELKLLDALMEKHQSQANTGVT